MDYVLRTTPYQSWGIHYFEYNPIIWISWHFSTLVKEKSLSIVVLFRELQSSSHLKEEGEVKEKKI